MSASAANASDFAPVVINQVAAPARFISQRNCLHAAGLDVRHFLDAVRDFGAAGGTVVALGKLRLVELDALMRWLAARTAPSRPRGAADDAVDQLATELGLVVR